VQVLNALRISKLDLHHLGSGMRLTNKLRDHRPS
jgi:hypothetical protein